MECFADVTSTKRCGEPVAIGQVAALQRKPENVLLHWAGSVLAWRNTCAPHRTFAHTHTHMLADARTNLSNNWN
eukprot:2718926-Amphidinium_carterae.1